TSCRQRFRAEFAIRRGASARQHGQDMRQPERMGWTGATAAVQLLIPFAGLPGDKPVQAGRACGAFERVEHACTAAAALDPGHCDRVRPALESMPWNRTLRPPG